MERERERKLSDQETASQTLKSEKAELFFL